MKTNHDNQCEWGLSPNDQAQGGKRLDGGPTCYCAERQKLHLLGCDEYHAHKAPNCCTDNCWCRPGMNVYGQLEF